MRSITGYKIIRSKRRTISLVITKEPSLVIRAPFRVSEDYIQNLVNQKLGWIQKKFEEMAKRPKTGKQFINGEEFLFLGKTYKLQITENLKNIQALDKLYLPEKKLPKAKKHIVGWYKKQAKEIVVKRTRFMADRFSFNPSSIRISGAMRRWGSCNSKRRINFSWRLVMTPREVIDYVIVHELSHLAHLNHSKNFWAKVKAILPDYKDRIKWLKQNDNLLTI
ncbi:M48 family metallopeptidase [Candidatus Peregrinibacteria bacterium]|nr:M48 family metallopeptidase [Candidatus Peregrinibacteria bacterium]